MKLQFVVDSCTVYPKKYAHGFVVLCFVVFMQSFIMNPHEVFIHINQGCFAGTGAIVRLPQCQWSKPDGYRKISQCITTTKYSKAKTVCIFLGIYCNLLTSLRAASLLLTHDDVIKWKHFPRYWPFVPGIHRSPINSPHKGQWCRALMFSLICAWIYGWANNREADNLRRHRAHNCLTVTDCHSDAKATLKEID